jgi:hypothetical protein
MANPILIIIGILLVLWITIKFKEMRHRFFGTLILIMILVLFLSASHVIKKESIDLKSKDGFIKFGQYYMSWLTTTFSQAKEITGSVIKQDWGINNTKINYLPNSTK